MPRQTLLATLRPLIRPCRLLLLGALLALAGGLLLPSQAAPSPQVAVQSQPPTAAYSLPPEKLAQAQALGRMRATLHFLEALWGIAVLWALLATKALSRLELWVERLVRPRWIATPLFFALLLLTLHLAGLPLALYRFHLGRASGILVQGWGGWLADQGKSLALTLLLGAPLLTLFLAIVRRWPRRYWLAAWMATLPLLALGAFAGPLVEPLFNPYEPLALHHPELAARLERVAARTGELIPPERILLMKASAKTNGLNAYVSGLGPSKRIVVWDTTAGRIPDEQILFIFAHESGHYALRHIAQGLAATALLLFLVYPICAWTGGWLARGESRRWALPTGRELSSRAGFCTLLLVVSAASFLLEPVQSAASRHIEHEADVYGQEALHGLVADPRSVAVASFQSLGESWLEDPHPNPFVEFWSFSHPSIARRAAFARQYDPWAQGGSGRFFPR